MRALWVEYGPGARYQAGSDGRDRGLRAVKLVALMGFVVGIALRLVQLLSGRSIYMDEAAIALNLQTRSFGGLLAPLDYAQTAAPAYLWAQKLVALSLGTGEIALRLLPFLAACAAVPLVYAIARRSGDRWVAAAALLVFAFAEPLVYFAADAKPYSFDVTCGAAATLLAMRCLDDPLSRRDAMLLGLGGFALLPWSQGVTLVLLGSAASLLLARRSWRRAAVALVWVTGCAIAILIARRALSPGTADYMHLFWAGGFMPWQPWAALRWLARTVYGLPYVVLGVSWPLRLAGDLVLLAGLLAVPRKWLGLLLGPTCAVLVAAATRQYPAGALGPRFSFDGRVVLFLAPTLAILAGAGGVALWRTPRLRLVSRGLLIIALCGLALPTLANARQHREPIRPVLKYVLAHSLAGDRAYVYYGAFLPVRYYRARVGLDRLRLVQGRCHRENPAGYARELLDLGPGRTWIVYSHADSTELEILRQSARVMGPILADTASTPLGGDAMTQSGAVLVDARPGLDNALPHLIAAPDDASGAFVCAGIWQSVTAKR